MDIGIIGGGSLGLLISSYLSLNHHVTLYVRRSEQMHEIERTGIALKRQHVQERQAKVTVRIIDDLQRHEIVFITVKQPHIEDIITKLHTIDGPNNFIFLQNGMGHIDKITSLRSAIYVGVVEHGAMRLADNVVDHLGCGTIKLAAFNEQAQSLTELHESLDEPNFPFEMSHSWERLLAEKLLINAVINPLTTLFDVSNGAITHNSNVRKLAQGLTNETATVLGFDQVSAWENVARVAENTKHNTSSMRADMLHGRPTEIEAISGYLLEKASATQIPYTSFVYEAILALEEKSRLIKED